MYAKSMPISRALPSGKTPNACVFTRSSCASRLHRAGHAAVTLTEMRDHRTPSAAQPDAGRLCLPDLQPPNCAEHLMCLVSVSGKKVFVAALSPNHRGHRQGSLCPENPSDGALTSAARRRLSQEGTSLRTLRLPAHTARSGQDGGPAGRRTQASERPRHSSCGGHACPGGLAEHCRSGLHGGPPSNGDDRGLHPPKLRRQRTFPRSNARNLPMFEVRQPGGRATDT